MQLGADNEMHLINWSSVLKEAIAAAEVTAYLPEVQTVQCLQNL